MHLSFYDTVLFVTYPPKATVNVLLQIETIYPDFIISGSILRTRFSAKY